MNIEKGFINRIVKNFIKATYLICKVDKKYCFIVSFFVIFSSLLPAISLKVMQRIVNMIQVHTANIDTMTYYIIIYLLIGLSEVVVSSAVNYYKGKFTFKFNIQLKKSILEKASRLKLKDYENSETYDMLKRAESQTNGDLVHYFDTVLSVIGSLITASTYIIIVAAFRVWIIPVLVLLPIVRFIILNRINVEEFNMVRNRTDKERKSWYNGYIITCGFNFKELKLYNLFDFFIGRHVELLKIFAKQDLRILRKRILTLIIFSIFEQLLVGALFGYTIYCGYIGVILIGDVITYTRAIVSTKEQIQGSIETLSTLNRSCLFFEQLFDFMDLEESDNKYKYSLKEISKIEIKDLSFKYDGAYDYSLKNINLTIEKGDFIAMVGRNGSGKSTLLKILLGMYDSYEGDVYIDGCNLRDINKAEYYKCVGVLFQDFTKYEATIRENVSYSDVDKINYDGEILNACEKFGLKDFVAEQPDGIDTQLGYWFETGKELSYGQWQKIALARAFMRDADIYFLDEPNASLDVISEQEILNSYEKIFEDKIGVVIVHKIKKYARRANKIVVLKNGEAVGIGTHSDLIKNCHEYIRLFSLQDEV